VTVDLGATVNVMRGGIGASMHAIEDPLPVGVDGGDYRSWGGSVWGANPDPGDDAAWAQVYRYADWLGLDWNRVEVSHRMFRPVREAFVTDSREMRILYRYLDWNQSRGADVLLQEMWPDAEWLAYPRFREDRVLRLRSAPADLDTWADGLVLLVDELVRKRGYTCIRWLSIANEPMQGWSWWRDERGEPQSIVPALALVRAKLDARGLGEIGLAAPDFPTPLPPLGEPAGFAAHSAAYSFHDYVTVFDWWEDVLFPYPMPSLGAYFDELGPWKKAARADGDKPLFLAEHGTFMQGFERDARGPGHYLSLLKDVQFVLRGTNAGVDAFNRWSFINRGDLDGQWQMIDTWDRKEKRLLPQITPHPNSYFLYGLLTRFVARHSRVARTDVAGGRDAAFRRLFAAAYESPKGVPTLVLTNDGDDDVPVRLHVKGLRGPATLHRYAVTRQAKDRSDVVVEPLASRSLSGAKAGLADVVPAKSVVVWSGYRLAMADKGVVRDE
jgi:hypothetical protein